MKVLFVMESGWEHGCYLPVFADFLERNPQFGVQPQLLPLQVGPLDPIPEATQFLRRLGLDGHFSRARRALSAEAHRQIDARRGSFDVLLLDTQAAGLDLTAFDRPVFVCVDATFQQLGRTPWFSELAAARRLAPSLMSEILAKEQALYARAAKVFAWSQAGMRSLREDYGVPADKLVSLPPSVEIRPEKKNAWPPVPRGLFIGEELKRSGGDLLLETYHSYFRGRIELDVLTDEKVRPEPGVRVFRDIHSGSHEWQTLWEEAHFFVFPARLEIFGTTLLEALAWSVPVMSSRAGAAGEILAGGEAGLLLDELTVDSLASSLETFLGDRKSMLARAAAGRSRVESEYNLRRNAARLATALNGRTAEPLPEKTEAPFS